MNTETAIQSKTMGLGGNSQTLQQVTRCPPDNHSFLDAWNQRLVQETDRTKIQQGLGEMLEHMLEHGLPDITQHCLGAIRNVFEADIESIPEEPELPDVSQEMAEKIASLIRIVDAQYGVSGSKNRLNHL